MSAVSAVECGSRLTLRARTIEDLARALDDLDRGCYWTNSLLTKSERRAGLSETVITRRAMFSEMLTREIEGFPADGHCGTCGRPLNDHPTPKLAKWRWV